MKELKDLPLSHYNFVKHCRSVVELMFKVKPAGEMVPPILMVLSDKDDSSLLTFDVNLMKEDPKKFAEMSRKKDKMLAEKGFDIVIYALVCEARRKVVKARKKSEKDNGATEYVDSENFNDIDAQSEDIVLLAFHGIGFNYQLMYLKKDYSIVEEMFNVRTEGKMNVFDEILNDKILNGVK